MSRAVTLPGQRTLLSCWRALGATPLGPGAVVTTPGAVAAVFPGSPYFNNAILTGGADHRAAATAAVAEVYARAGIGSWALWVPSPATDFASPAAGVEGTGALVRDVTTLVMHARLGAGGRRDARVRTVSTESLSRLTMDEPVTVEELGVAGAGAAVTGWALVERDEVVTSAFTHRRGADLGVYAVGTLPPWRRRGLARALLEHVLADAYAAGARTATLQSTPMAQRLYESLGFRAAGRYDEWVYAVAPTR